MGKIIFRAVIEVAGKPKEHVGQTLKDYVENWVMKVFELLKQIRKKRGTCAIALVDPDTKNDYNLSDTVKLITDSD